MRSTDEYLNQPRKTLSWAHKALLQLEPEIARYFGQAGLVVPLTEFDADTGENVYKLRITEPVSEAIEEIATNALLHAKNGLDQCVFNASRALGVDLEGNNYFPWSTGPADMKGKLKRAKVPEELWDAIASHEPYKRSDAHPGGDDVIRCLATLANDKHTIGLRPVGHITEVRYPNIRGGPVLSLKVLAPVWDAVANEMEIVRYIGDVEIKDDYVLTCHIAMAHPGLPQPVDAMGALSAFIEKALSTYERLRSQCVALRGC